MLIVQLNGHQAGVRSAAFSPDGQRVVTASDDKTARVWELTTGQVIAQLNGHQAPVRSAAFSPDGQRVVTASYDKTARVWNVVRWLSSIKGGASLKLCAGRSSWAQTCSLGMMSLPFRLSAGAEAKMYANRDVTIRGPNSGPSIATRIPYHGEQDWPRPVRQASCVPHTANRASSAVGRCARTARRRRTRRFGPSCRSPIHGWQPTAGSPIFRAHRRRRQSPVGTVCAAVRFNTVYPSRRAHARDDAGGARDKPYSLGGHKVHEGLGA
ncbi:WD40 repeat domain-containing protein [Cupriavidus necator]|uniref:WD40 repeat domain-containing protein n=1 Tax=Cupriavidus necator TaxID=106590 RepID=UPI0039C354D9